VNLRENHSLRMGAAGDSRVATRSEAAAPPDTYVHQVLYGQSERSRQRRRELMLIGDF